eukprot:1507974-Prorocentrum_lima.AAC.1
MELAERLDPMMAGPSTLAASCKGVGDWVTGEHRIYPVISADTAPHHQPPLIIRSCLTRPCGQ